jgi:ribosome biogenesis protein MAK21
LRAGSRFVFDENGQAMKKSVPELEESDVDDDESLGSPGLQEDGDDDDGSADVKLDDSGESDDSAGSEMDFLEDEGDIVSDEDGDPTGLVAFPSGEESDGAGDDEWQGFGEDAKTRKRSRDKGAAEGRKKRRKLATFASYEDYAAMIEKSQEDNI